MRAVENTGDIGKPLITLHGTLDALLPISTDSDVYDQPRRRRRPRRRSTATTSSRAATTSTASTTRSAARCARSCRATARPSSAHGGAGSSADAAPPPDQTVPKPASGDVVNTCALAPAAADARPPPPAALAPRGLTLRARRVGRRVRVRGRLRLPDRRLPRRPAAAAASSLRAGRRRARASACAFRVTLRAPRARRVRARFAGNAVAAAHPRPRADPREASSRPSAPSRGARRRPRGRRLHDDGRPGAAGAHLARTSSRPPPELALRATIGPGPVLHEVAATASRPAKLPVRRAALDRHRRAPAASKCPRATSGSPQSFDHRRAASGTGGATAPSPRLRALRDPRGHRDDAAGLDDAQQLARRRALVGREHRAEDRQARVEASPSSKGSSCASASDHVTSRPCRARPAELDHRGAMSRAR